ncbi:hypothetical protein [Bradyrhizobium elkanii]|uniref:hypothetical protein n=1 Tax=Bradyrhizobium elkanii TaxID=29448 RepID=UPI001BA9970E|nr:hypothetical protein [Bradyrhizobium elkanii]MBR1165030.1 hypothetical protein [Bradyrhizobium elkanii]
MTEVRFSDRLDVAIRAEQPGLAECVVAVLDTWRGSMPFRLERLEGNRWAIWKERENNNFDGEYEAKTVEQSRERILLDDAGLLNAADDQERR